MKQSKNHLIYLKHILDSIEQIQLYTKGIRSEKEFSENRMVQDAVIRHLEIIGEASKKVNNTIKTENDSIPWKAMAGMRDKLIHDYLGTNMNFIWNTVKKDLPNLKKNLKTILKEKGFH